MASFLKDVFDKVHELGKTVGSAWYFHQAQEHHRLYQLSLSEGNGDLSELDEAIELLRKSASKILEGEPEHTFEKRQIWFTLARSFQWRFEKTGVLEDLDEAIRYLRECIGFTRSGEQRVEMISNVASLLGFRYAKSHDRDNLNEALDLLAGVEDDISGKDVTDLSFFMAQLFLLRIRFDLNQDLRDMDKSIDSGKRAIQLLGAKEAEIEQFDQVSAKVLGLLGSSMFFKFLAVGDINLLTEAIQTLQKAIDGSPRDLPDRFLFSSGLGAAMTERYIRTGNPQDLKNAMKLIEPTLVAAHDQISPSEYAQILCNYGIALGWESQRTGNDELLEKAIHQISEALKIVADGDFDNSTMQMNLGVWLLTRYRRSWALGDLYGAITAFRAADDRFPINSHRRLESAQNLCVALGDRFSRTKDAKDLNEAIICARKALSFTNAADPVGQVKSLLNLSAMLCQRYESLLPKHHLNDGTESDRTDLNEAITHLRMAAEIVTTNSPFRGQVYSGLSRALAFQFEARGVGNDLDEAITYAKFGVDATPDTEPSKALCLHNYAERLLLKSQITRDLQDVEQTYQAYERAFRIESAPPYIRIEMAKMAGVLSLIRISTGDNLKLNDWLGSYKMLCDALSLLPQISTKNLTRDDHQRLLRKLSGVSAIAASVALQTNETASTALTLLESGRGIMAGLAIESQDDLSQLQIERPDLFHSYQELTRILSAPIPTQAESILPLQAGPALANMANQLSSKPLAAKKLRELQAKIRICPGFEDFQTPLSENQMKATAISGPVVIFNTNMIRCDAFVITSETIRVLPLPSLDYETVENNLKQLTSQDPDDRITHLKRRTDKGRQNIILQKILSWLWEDAVKPVLAELDFLKPNHPNKLLPRIWWVAAGPLGMMPLHAAGSHWFESTENAASHVVSCYIPTIKALSYVQDKIARQPQVSIQSFTGIAVSKTKGKADLCGMVEKLARIQSLLADAGIHKSAILDTPSKDELIAQLKEACLVHFACHATSDTDDPSNSRLFLRADKTGEPECLTVRDLGAVKLSNKLLGLAYLSACSTSESLAADLADETLNIANAFQLLGFPHVIGTLWEAEVDTANILAELFYKHVVSCLPNPAMVDKSAVYSYALHYALQDLRLGSGTTKRAELCCKDVLAWAPFVYVGY